MVDFNVQLSGHDLYKQRRYFYVIMDDNPEGE
jgi:hypothetical protein